MKKQLTLISAVAAAMLSAPSYSAQFEAGTLSGATTDPSNTIKGSDEQYIKSDFVFKLSNTVELQYIQDADALAATTASASGKSVYGSSSGAGTISQCRVGTVVAVADDPATIGVDETVEAVVGGDPLSTIGAPTIANSCAGAS